jgi:peptide-methionine (S)-S-oxide reductase
MLDHTEAIRIEFNPAEHSFSDLLRVFLKGIDPFNRCSSSRQYRYAIWYVDEQQKAEIDAVIRAICQAKGKTRADFKVDVEAAVDFYKAEEYHQHYTAKARGRFNAKNNESSEDEA